jgi:hypothetical protein
MHFSSHPKSVFDSGVHSNSGTYRVKEDNSMGLNRSDPIARLRELRDRLKRLLLLVGEAHLELS